MRQEFRARMAHVKRPQSFSSRNGVVLSGGGARGAYEAGVLMAFQDAEVPTPIIAATSVGSINAASYAAEAEGLVGRAEPLVKAWLELTPATLGIDWSRYIFLLTGLVAASAGIGNFVWQWMKERGIYLHAHHPKLTWLSLAAAGGTILLFSDKLSYIAQPDWHAIFTENGKGNPRKAVADRHARAGFRIARGHEPLGSGRLGGRVPNLQMAGRCKRFA